MNGLWFWVTLAALGAFHGLNPAMGWLFAVTLGFQQRDRRAVLHALGPIALGHALSIAVVVAIYTGARAVISPRALALGSIVTLLGFGAFKLLRPLVHFRWVGMRVGPGQLTLWSFLMATGHGAGLMLLPAFGATAAITAADSNPHISMAGITTLQTGPAVLAVALHTLSMLAVAGVIVSSPSWSLIAMGWPS